MWSMKTNSFAGGAGAEGGDGQAVTVTLVGPMGGSTGQNRASAAARSSAELSTLLNRFRDVPSPIAASDRPSRSGDADKLFKEISQSQGDASEDRKAKPNPGQGAGEGGQAGQSSKANGKDSHAKAVQGVADERGDEGHVNGDMWSQLQTCWRPEARVPITLEIVIDNAGRLALPPKILRPLGAPVDERRLHAEALAIQAVGDCAPFRSGAPVFGRKTYRFAFNPPG
jgi:hypothetical protein